MKGTILSISPRTTVIDITHDLPPHSIRAAAFLTRWSYGYFPVGSIHVAVVDHGVGTSRRILAMEACGHRFLAPDNGLLYPVWEEIRGMGDSAQLYEVQDRAFWLDRVSSTFHGRDVFSPVAAHLSKGMPVSALGPELQAPESTLHLPEPHQTGDELRGEILYVDRFGNLISNLGRLVVEEWRTARGLDLTAVEVCLDGNPLGCLGGTYGSVEPGAAVMPYDGFDMLEIAINQASAAQHFQAGAGAAVALKPR